jgi:hypothetical protein
MTEALISFLRNHVLFSLLAEDTLGRLVQQLEMTSFALTGKRGLDPMRGGRGG